MPDVQPYDDSFLMPQKSPMLSTISINKPHEDADLDNNSTFLVNKNGFPLDDRTWERMWDYVAMNHIDGYQIASNIRKAQHLDQVEVPQAPLKVAASISVPQRLILIQDYMKSLQYNHTGTQFFDVRKNRPISGLMEVAKDIVRESLPIKCLEAVILALFHSPLDLLDGCNFGMTESLSYCGLLVPSYRLYNLDLPRYLTNGMENVERFPTLTELIYEYVEKYSNYDHVVKKIKIGLPVSHDAHSYECIQWKSLVLNLPKMTKCDVSAELEKTARTIKSNVRSVWVNSPRKTYLSLREITRSSNHLNGSRDTSPPKFIPKDRSPKKKKSKSRINQGYQIRI